MEQTIIAWVSAHALALFVGYVVYMVLVQALPKPDEKSGKLYLFIFAFAHGLAANVGMVGKALKIGGVGVAAAEPEKKDSTQAGK